MDEGEPMRLLISNFRSRMEKQSSGQSHPLYVYTDKLLAAFAPPVDRQTTIINSKSELVEPASHREAEVRKAKTMLVEPEDQAAKIALLDPLSERELEVLKLLRTELSGPEIAGHLVISPNTFRTHTKNIFSKLGVNNRRAAVRRAEELDLI
jgi:ATP/maltotriose-dependent transcriptional regulator MalT